MQIFKHLKSTSAALAVSGMVFLAPAYALDASKIIKKDTKSSTIFQLFFGFIEDGKSDEAFDVLKYAADQGNSAAQWKLAKMYERGEQGVQKDPLEAFKMFHKIAAKYTLARPNTPSWQFSADALLALGNYYRKGIPNTIVIPDTATATTMYTTAALVFRHPGGYFQLGRMQIENDRGFGQGKIGFRNLRQAEEQGHVGAEALVGFTLFEGVHTKQNIVSGLVKLGHARHRATADDYEWINQLYEEAFSIAKPEDRTKANQLLQEKLNRQ